MNTVWYYFNTQFLKVYIVSLLYENFAMFYQVFFGIVETLKFVWAPKTFKIWVPIFFKIAETLCLLPVHWDKNKFKLVLLRSKVRPFIWKFFALYNTFCSILALKILRTLYQEKQDADSLIKLLLDGTGRIFGCLVVVWMGRNFKETIPFFNQVYTLHYQLAQKSKSFPDLDTIKTYVAF